ncbi:cytochrome c [Shewanella fodinae]|uniref:Mono/diheme cytochrome c family protein n=1 Tax=Shewanella fodinae TaxID=552357 RepID=A0A4R2FIG2_9GAMM|nr:cytochrome c [Shewanella fodinae]TCN90685.1 mono/diheme cytochrome c family protein [Shewanella fodinae]
MRKRIIYSICGVVVAGLVLFGIYAWHPEIAPVTPPAKDQFPAATVAHGKVLAAAGYCSTCHTAPGGQEYAGNYQMNTDFGTIYSSNITPDPETGIGNWSEAAFIRAMRTGVSRDGHHLLPAFPFEHFNKMTDDDIKAIYAYIMSSVPAVKQQKQANGIPFPLNIRFLQAGWKMLFADTSAFEKQSDKSDEWNRGAYLAEGIAHCGACHTPRNALGGEKYSHMYEGAAIDGWIAPSLTASSKSPLPWRQQDFYEYLRTGNSLFHGSAAGPMAPVVHHGLAALSDDDIKALSVYFGDLAGNNSEDPATSPKLQAAIAAQHPMPDARINQGARLYATACASCHFSGSKLRKGRPLLALGSATHLNDPTNLVNVMLDGVRSDQGIPGVVMPAFRDALSDDEIAAIAEYLRHSAGEQPWPNLQQKVGEIRHQPRFEH